MQGRLPGRYDADVTAGSPPVLFTEGRWRFPEADGMEMVDRQLSRSNHRSEVLQSSLRRAGGSTVAAVPCLAPVTC